VACLCDPEVEVGERTLGGQRLAIAQDAQRDLATDLLGDVLVRAQLWCRPEARSRTHR